MTDANIEEYDWIDRNEYPFKSRYWQVADGRLHYIDEGEGEAVVFVHGNPTWSFMYRKQIAGLRAKYRCVAVDHLGFGLSDKPADVPYSPQLHAMNLTALIEGLKLKNITLVLHDWGGPIGMSYALDNPANVARIVICNTHFWSLEGVRGAEIFSRLVGGPIGQWLCRRFNAFPRFVMPRVYGKTGQFDPTTQQHYINPFPSPDTRNGTWRFARAIIGESHWLASLWNRRMVLTQKPLCIFWGAEDPVGTPDKLLRWQGAFPNHQTMVFERAGHFVPEQVGEELVEPLCRFLSTT